MYVPRRLLIGLAAAFAGGLLVAAAQASVARQYDDSPLAIPTSRLGDEVTYAHFEKGKPDVLPLAPAGRPSIYDGLPGSPIGGPSPSPSPTSDKSQWGEPVFAGSRVGPLSRTPDRAGQLHDTLLVTSRKNATASSTLAEHVDLETRRTIRSDWNHHITSVGTRTQLVVSGFDIVKPQLPGLELQGRTLRLGDDVTDAYVLPDWIDPTLDHVEVESRVDRRAFIEGRDTYGVRTELHFRENARSGTPEAQEAALFGDEYRLVLVEFTHVSPDLPYPVLIHRYVNWLHGPDSVAYEEMDSLVEYRAGTTRVAWAEGAHEPVYRAQNPFIERSKTAAMVPEGGRGNRIQYPLEAAIRNVHNDLTLAQFQAWKLQHPEHRLVGANLEHSRLTEEPGSLRWTLFFATFDGQAFAAASERLGATGGVVNREIGEHPVPRFTEADLPRGPITLAAADDLWSSLASPEVAKNPPNRVLWGWGDYPTRTSRVGQLRELQIGHETRSQQNEGSTLLTLDTVSGNVLTFQEARTDFECADCFIIVYTPERPAVVPNTVSRGVQPPGVTEAAVASTGLIALFLALYFLPLGHFLGTQALLLLPGFAKLRKERILDNALRDQILHLIKTEPGIHASDIARRVDAGWGTVVYHLSVLERSKMISSLVDGRHKRFFPVGVVDFSRRGQLAVLRNATTKSIFELIASDPGVIQGEIANRNNLSVPAAIWHLRRLEEVGLVGRAKDGRRVHYYANEEEYVPVPYDERDAVEIV